MLTNAQADTVAAYLLEVFPGSGRERQHSHTSAWQMASEALDALGYAEETTRSDIVRKNELDHVFFERWRLDDGWLNDETGGRALSIFHDLLGRHVASIFESATHEKV